MFDPVLEQYLFGAVDESKVQVQLHSAKKTVLVSLQEWRTKQLEFKKKDDVFEEEFVNPNCFTKT